MSKGYLEVPVSMPCQLPQVKESPERLRNGKQIRDLEKCFGHHKDSKDNINRNLFLFHYSLGYFSLSLRLKDRTSNNFIDVIELMYGPYNTFY